MANHFSALKRARQTVRRTAVNRTNRTRVRSAVRRFREAMASGNSDSIQQMFRETVSALDKSVQKGSLHKNTASRYKARLSARLTALAAK